LRRVERSKNSQDRREHDHEAKMNAKLAIRIAVLAVVMVGVYMAGRVEPVSSADGGYLIEAVNYVLGGLLACILDMFWLDRAASASVDFPEM
jgi:hypothetical protein